MSLKKWFEETDSITNLERTRNLAIIGGAISGITVIWTVLFAQFSGGLEGYSAGKLLAGFLATGLTLLVVYVIDYGTKVDLPYALDLLFSGRAFRDLKHNWRVLLFALILLSFNFIRLGFTAAIDWYGRGDMISVVMHKPLSRNVVALKDSLSKATVATVAGLASDIKELKRQLRQVERQVATENPELAKNIRDKKDKWGWNAGELRRRKDKATKPIHAKIAAKEALYAERLAAEGKVADALTLSALSDNEAAQAEYNDKHHRLSFGVGVFGAGCSGIVLVVSIMLALINSANQDNPYYHKKHEAKKQTVESSATIVESPATTPATVAATVAPNLQTVPIRNENRDDEALKRLIVMQAEKLSTLSAQVLDLKNRPVETVERVVERIVEKPATVVEKTPEPLSDNGSTKKTTVEKIEQSIEVVQVDTKNLRDATIKQWQRSFISKDEKTREENRQKAEKGIKRLEELGFNVVPDGMKLSITSKS